LGLAAVAGIIRGHKGAILVRSQPGKGSALKALFPAAAGVAIKAAAAAPREALRGSGIVLMVDDEPIVRDMARRVLERYGYTVLVAASGPEAIDIFRRQASEIAIVILDLSMPRMSGEETLRELRNIRSGVRVMISSGYNEADTMALLGGQQVSGFIQKPYTSKGLAERVKLMLG
jgi:CheY-like chemotaxis protein